MNFPRVNRRATLKIALGAAVTIPFCACRVVEVDADMKMEATENRDHDDPAAIQVIQSVCSRNRPFRFGGRDYTVTLFRRGDRFFLRSCLDPDCGLGASALKELGKNIVISKPGLVFENDRMTVEYRDPSGKRRKACVPFGDVYGSIHTSEMPRNIFGRYEGSEKYGVAGALKKDDAVIESCIPTLRELLRRDDAETLSGMMVYPLPVHAGCGLTFVKDRKEFVELYPRIFTPTRKREIMKLKDTDICRSSKGLMIDRGLWFFVGTDGKPYFLCLFFAIG